MSLDMNTGDAWRYYKQMLNQAEISQEAQEELAKRDPLFALRQKRPAFAFSMAMLFILEDSLSERFTKVMAAHDISALLLTLHAIFIDFQATLSKLCQEDLSMHMPYLQELSRDWKNLETLIRQILHFKETQNPQIAEIVKKSEDFMNEVCDFKGEEQYPLAYYLGKQAGQDWVPFPFMRIVQHLHEEFQTIGAHSILQKWFDEMDTLIAKTQSSEL